MANVQELILVNCLGCDGAGRRHCLTRPPSRCARHRPGHSRGVGASAWRSGYRARSKSLFCNAFFHFHPTAIAKWPFLSQLVTSGPIAARRAAEPAISKTGRLNRNSFSELHTRARWSNSYFGSGFGWRFCGLSPHAGWPNRIAVASAARPCRSRIGSTLHCGLRRRRPAGHRYGRLSSSLNSIVASTPGLAMTDRILRRSPGMPSPYPVARTMRLGRCKRARTEDTSPASWRDPHATVAVVTERQGVRRTRLHGARALLQSPAPALSMRSPLDGSDGIFQVLPIS